MCRCELGDERAIAEALSVKDQAIRIEDDKGEMPLHKLARQGCVPSLNPSPDLDPNPNLCIRRPWGVRAAACCSVFPNETDELPHFLSLLRPTD